MAIKFEQTLQVSTFANGPWKENFLGIDLRQIGQNPRNSGKLVPQEFAFNKIDILKVILWNKQGFGSR